MKQKEKGKKQTATYEAKCRQGVDHLNMKDFIGIVGSRLTSFRAQQVTRSFNII